MTTPIFAHTAVVAALLWCAAAPAAAQRALPFTEYLDAAEQHSLVLQSQREGVTSAQAGVGIAGIRPDPVLSYTATRETVKTSQPRPVSHNPSLSWEIETGGKRQARIKEAKSNVKLAEANVQGTRRQLDQDAANAFAEACRTRESLARKEQTLRALAELVRANEVRKRAGDVGGVELLQSRVEHDQFEADVTQARADHDAALEELSVPLGRRVSELFGQPELQCEFRPYALPDDLQQLLDQAMQERDDIRIAEATVDNARDKVSLARANRWVNPTVSVGVTATRGYGAGTGADGAPYDATMRSRQLALGISVPLPLSRLDRGDLVQAESELTQAMLGLQQSRQQAEAEVRAAVFRFKATRTNVTRYQKDVLANAQRMLDGIRLSYRHGQASLLELLQAQRSTDDAFQAYLQARADLAGATVQLQLSLGQRPVL